MPDILSNGIALFVAWLLALSSWHKFSDLSFYRSLVSTYLGGLAVPMPLVAALAAVEAGVALLILVPPARGIALACAAGILLAYALLMASKLLEGRRDLRCGCSGPAAKVLLSPALVVRNMVCVGLCLAAIPLAPAGVGFVFGLSSTLVVAGFLVLMYLCCEQLISNAQQMARRVS